MSLGSTTTVEVFEYRERVLPPDAITPAIGETLFRDYGAQLDVEFPTPKTDHQWVLRSRGWIGHIPVASGFSLALRPRVPLANLFGMLEYAYQLKSFKLLPGLVHCESLTDFFNELAKVLSRRVSRRTRRGIYRAYVPERDRLPFVRGRMDMPATLRRPWLTSVPCDFEDITADVEDNQLLAWTLWSIAHSSSCKADTRVTVGHAFRDLRHHVALTPFGPEACIGRHYHRLNADYESMHALCRFFLERSGPAHDRGDRAMLPFLVNMARLFELFVAEWLKAHPPEGLMVRAQDKMPIGDTGALRFEIDLVLQDADTGLPRFVIDTKYKTPTSPAPDDIYQVVAYATAKRTREAILLYPAPLAQPLDVRVGDIRVRSMAFAVDGDLEAAGQAFVARLST